MMSLRMQGGEVLEDQTFTLRDVTERSLSIRDLSSTAQLVFEECSCSREGWTGSAARDPKWREADWC